MFKKFELKGVHIDLDDNTTKYVNKKIGQLDKYLPRKLREAAHAEVTLGEVNTKDSNHCSCEVTLYLPKETINVKESTVNTFAAIDIVETKLKNRIMKYKGLHHNSKLKMKVISKFKRRGQKF